MASNERILGQSFLVNPQEEMGMDLLDLEEFTVDPLGEFLVEVLNSR